MKRLFGTDGIRGVAGKGPLAPEEILSTGRALARVLAPQGGTAIVCRDTRRSGPLVRDALVAGMLAEGLDVIDAGIRPTPALPYLAKAHGADVAVVISASHNSMEFNGIKVFGPAGDKISDELEDAVEAARHASPTAHTGAGVGRARPMRQGPDPYREAMVASGGGEGTLSGLSLVLDGANGAGWEDGPAVLRRLGAEVTTLFTAPDGDNINAGCGALHPETLAAAVAESGAFGGVALDGDGDRAILVDETGTVRDGDYVLAALGSAYRRQGRLPGDTVVGTVMSNVGLEVYLDGHGIALERTDVGDRQIAKAMTANGWALGGEPSGHVIFREEDALLPGDGLLTAMNVFRASKEAGVPLSRLAEGFKTFPQTLVNVAVSAKPPFDEIPGLAEEVHRVRQSLGRSGRVVLRYSGTEPKCRVMVEGPDEQTVTAHAMAIGKVLKTTVGVNG